MRISWKRSRFGFPYYHPVSIIKRKLWILRFVLWRKYCERPDEIVHLRKSTETNKPLHGQQEGFVGYDRDKWKITTKIVKYKHANEEEWHQEEVAMFSVNRLEE